MLNRILVRDLAYLRGQTIAAMLVIACGVAAFVSMRSTYESLLFAQRDYYARYQFADVFAQVKRAPISLASQLRAIPGVAVVEVRVVTDVTVSVPGLNEPASARLVSMPKEDSATLNRLFVREGRRVNVAREDEILISEAFAKANQLHVGDHIGAILNGKWKSLRVVGIALSPEFIYEVGSGSLFPDNRRFGVLWMDEKAVRSAFDMEAAFNDVIISAQSHANLRQIIDRVDRLLEPYGGVGAFDREEQVSHRFISDEISQNRVTSGYIPALFFGVAAFLLHIVLTRLVSLQRAQIGLLRAFGFTNRAIVAHYFKLAIAMVAGGIVLGVAGGWYLGNTITALYRNYYRFPILEFQSSTGVIATAIIVSFLTALTGAMWAVTKVAQLPPAEAMRPPSPPTFRPGVVERLGAHRIFSAGTRMIWRNISRRSGRSILSIAGMASAVGILLVGGYFLDAIDYLLMIEFQYVQRQDVSVLFHEPRSRIAARALSHMPGVIGVEPFRLIPANVQFEHRSRRVQITAMDPKAQMHRFIDKDLRAVDVPNHGVVITRKLAEILGASVGQNLAIDVLEGKRLKREVPIVGVVDELTGLGVYMSQVAVEPLLQEAGTISGAYLAIDARRQSELYSELKGLPVISGVAIREAMLASFNKILEESILLSTTINIIFACVIAAGISYNNVRIALSERANELASLRVLGFNYKEITRLLLGEQAILTAAAVPVGFALGYWICALLSHRLNTELYRIPLIISPRTLVLSALVVAVASAMSGMLVARKLRSLDLVAVLKSRE